jgi:hypothetical protein
LFFLFLFDGVAMVGSVFSLGCSNGEVSSGF